MTVYIMCITSEADVAAVAGHLEGTHVPFIRGPRGRLNMLIAHDVLVVVAHGNDENIGTSSNANDLSPQAFATLLINQHGLPDNAITVDVAACDTVQFAQNLQAEFAGSDHGNVRAHGQPGAFQLDATFQPTDLHPH